MDIGSLLMELSGVYLVRDGWGQWDGMAKYSWETGPESGRKYSLTTYTEGCEFLEFGVRDKICP